MQRHPRSGLTTPRGGVSVPVVCGRLPFYSSLDELDVVPDITVANNVRLPPPPNTMLRFDKSQDFVFSRKIGIIVTSIVLGGGGRRTLLARVAEPVDEPY